ncbi:MAG: Glu-tRNA(Gln) amidotransferase subunit GatE [bacterium]|nr:Glu-tRNA(Gln) amidotransferase subunit GatE [bacterium]
MTDIDSKKEQTVMIGNQLYQYTKKELDYLPISKATDQTYADLGFKCGLEIHQQLLTDQKLFCRCPAGIYQKDDDYDAELIRHMRPTLSELGEYDGTALMEFRTRKNIIYRIKDENSCTYDIDDTPPFPLNMDALEKALEISLLLGCNIVGELHIARKQYLDGSIPAGFQRTGILGIEGEIPIANKKIRIIQISIEEDSCREVSDIGHWRTYRTDRLGMPLIETVTYPDMLTPSESAEAAQYLRYLTRSSGQVRTGIGAAREDVNVSITGGTRVEIKGVAHIKWIPELTHNESFRQKALLKIARTLKERVVSPDSWDIKSERLDIDGANYLSLTGISDYEFHAINLAGFGSLIGHFTQPGQTFGDELAQRLKVIACIDHPNLASSESDNPELLHKLFDTVRDLFGSTEQDAQLIIWGPPEDIPTALLTIKERCQLAFEGVPNETRKSLPGGVTIFERVLPGPDRMYPDTDSAPIAIGDDLIECCRERMVPPVSDRIAQLNDWKIPLHMHNYLLKRNLVALMQAVIDRLLATPIFVARLLTQEFRRLDNYAKGRTLPLSRLTELFEFIKEKNLANEILFELLQPALINNKTSLSEILEQSDYEPCATEEITAQIPMLIEEYHQLCPKKIGNLSATTRWIMGQLRPKAIGNMPLAQLSEAVRKGADNVG